MRRNIILLGLLPSLVERGCDDARDHGAPVRKDYLIPLANISACSYTPLHKWERARWWQRGRRQRLIRVRGRGIQIRPDDISKIEGLASSARRQDS